MRIRRYYIFLLGDHGFQLGENAEWGKSTNFEASTHCPMMIRIPGRTESGIRIGRQFAETVDLAPTVVSAARLPEMTPCPISSSPGLTEDFCTEGSDLLPLIEGGGGVKDWKTATFSQFVRPDVPYVEGVEDTYDLYSRMGFSVRTMRYRYTEWVDFDFEAHRPEWGAPEAPTELYDYVSDPDGTSNVAEDPEYARVVEKLRERLRLGWRGKRAPK